MILGNLGSSREGAKDKYESAEPDEDVTAALKDAMSKFLKAVKSEDVSSMVTYLKDFVYLCEEKDSEE